MVLPYDNMDYGEDQIGARNIRELTDVELINLANGEVLKYNSSNNKWENQTTIGTESISTLTDTNITTPITNGSSLVYNTSNGKWENTLLVDIDTLNNLSDTNISSLADKDFLLYDNTSSKWINTPSIIDNLKNVSISSVANNEILKYNSTSGNWENNNLLINEINDVNITSLQNGEVLKYNTSTGKWENQDNTDTLNELTDVTLTVSSNNQVLKYNGSIWVNNFVNLTELADTNIPALNNGDILRYNSVSQKWETDTFNINDLDDVNITSVANNEVLKYNSTTSKWENSNRIDTLDELGDVALTGVTTGDLLRYNGSVFVNAKIALDNDFTNVNFTSLTNGDLIKYNGTNFINFAPTYLDGAGIGDNFLIKVVGGATTQTSFKETSVLNTSTSLQTYIPLGVLSVLAGSIETEFFNTIKTRMHLTTSGIATAKGITITSDGRVGIGVVEPEEDFELDGNIQLDTGGVQRGRVIFYDKQNNHEHAEVDGLGEGTNGGVLAFYTKVDGSFVTEKLRINNTGAIGIKGSNYGSSGQVLTTNGSGSAVSWETPITYSAGTGMSLVGTTFNNTAPDQIVTLTQGGSTTITGTYPNFTISSTVGVTYTAGTGVSISPSNVISIGQSVASSDSPSFTQMSLGNTGTNQSILNLKDFTNVGTETIAQIKGIKEGTNGGKLQIFTKVDGGSLTERMSILQNGLVKITTDAVGLLIASQDGVTEQGYIYNSGLGTKDFVIDAQVGSLAKGIAFRIGGSDKLKIGNNGELGIKGANYGNPGQVLTTNGSGSAVSWEDPTGTTYSAGTGLNLNGTTFSNPYNSFYPGTALYNGIGQYGVARVDFTNGDAMGFHGSNYGGYDYLDWMFTQEGVEIGVTLPNGSGWRGSQLLVLNAIGSYWEIYDFGTNVATRLVPYSDDRVKTHEQIFSGETYINYIKQIVPKKYKKYGVILTEEEEKLLEAGGDPFKDKRSGDPVKDSAYDPQIEYGVIAQDIHKISGLEDIVKVGDDKNKWSVDYRSIDTITLGAVKGLIDKIEKLEARIKTLEGK